MAVAQDAAGELHSLIKDFKIDDPQIRHELFETTPHKEDLVVYLLEESQPYRPREGSVEVWKAATRLLVELRNVQRMEQRMRVQGVLRHSELPPDQRDAARAWLDELAHPAAPARPMPPYPRAGTLEYEVDQYKLSRKLRRRLIRQFEVSADARCRVGTAHDH